MAIKFLNWTERNNMDHKTKTFGIFILPALFLFLFFGFAGGEENLPALTLAEGIRIAAENNPAVKAAYLEGEASYEDVVIARSRLLPSVNAVASINNLANQPASKFDSSEINIAERNSVSYGVSLNQLVFDFGASDSIYR